MRFPYHCIITSLHEISLPPHHCITTLVSHLPCPLPPNQSVICLVPCHQSSQSFALPLATKPVICLALYHRITVSPHHRATKPVSHLCHCITTPVSHLHCTLVTKHHCISHLPCPCHQNSQSFALPPATKPVSHLTCPLPLHHCMRFLYHHVNTSPHHHITTLVSQSFALPLPPNQSVICLAPCHQTSQSFALPTVTKLVSHLPCPCQQTRQSFDLPSTTASPHHCMRFLYHRITA